MLQYDLPNYLTVVPFKPAVSVAANFNGASFDLIGYEGKLLVRADIGNASAGTSPTLDLSFAKSTDNGNFVAANISFTQANAASAQTVAVDPRALGENYRYLRVEGRIGGTNSPAFPVSVQGYATKQFNPA